MAQLLDFISAHKETIACFPLSVFAHMAATIRELLGPEASIVHEIVTKEMGADSAIATHMVPAPLSPYPYTVPFHTTSQPSLPHLLLVILPLAPASTPLGARGRRLHHQPAQPLRHPPVGVRHGQSGAIPIEYYRT